ncbi:MAG: hypothetical protein GY746_00900 [Gammaproteobacteria bacterium]|nr:hypothetical protein [Gammaproteobacteria bacterium]MCP4088340.1 hypothetical protein [Gammaproteobacteria bacterium]MCP4275448.1 hypothetical protein [Gammaproteobacteria bacterium]MCP4830996.1 hypothetical protein [Gammaproteobacteria bacterium]MCP4927483.1 hypothetical protein [Gammaproteobacteria bacterium]
MTETKHTTPTSKQIFAEEMHFGRVALNLGFITEEELERALGAREELHAAGVDTLIGDIMLDRQLLTSAQCEQILTEQDRLLREAGLLSRVRAAPTIGLVVAGMVPVLSHMSLSSVLTWSGALLIGFAISNRSPWRWVGIGWLASIIAPGTSMASIGSSGSLLHGWRRPLGAVLLGTCLALIPLPETLHQAGPLFLLAAVVLALFRKPPTKKNTQDKNHKGEQA